MPAKKYMSQTHASLRCITLQSPQSEQAGRELAVQELLLVYSKQNTTVHILSCLEDLKILYKQHVTQHI